MKPVLVGCSGWNYRDWRGRLYPPGMPASRWLECYARHFSTVEVNSTFYRLVSRSTVERWIAQTPENFCFSVKASRYLTHVKRLQNVEQGIARFFDPLAPLRDAGRLAAVLWQLPETFHRDDGTLARLLEELPAGRHAVEFRHPSWFAEDVLSLLRAHDVALVLGDHPERPFPVRLPTAGWRYIRFHYGTRGRRGNYSEAELERWARRLHGWRRSHEVLAYFNNDWEGFAPRNAAWLQARLGRLAGESGPTRLHATTTG